MGIFKRIKCVIYVQILLNPYQDFSVFSLKGGIENEKNY